MVQRLVELYPLHTLVEIELGDAGWVRGQVAQHDHPGIWVQTEDGRFWFVTNRRRIRKREEA